MTNSSNNRFWRNPEVIIHPGPRPSGQSIIVSKNERHFRLEGLPKDIVLALDDTPRDIKSIVTTICAHTDGNTLERSYEALSRLQGRGLVYSDEPARSSLTGIPSRPDKLRSLDFLWRCTLFSPSVVRQIAGPLVPLFKPRLMSVGIGAMLLLQLVMLLSNPHLLHPKEYIQHLSPPALTLLIVGSYFALFMHELGHAAGCIAAGVKNGSIGVCLYLLFPGLFTDVTHSWKVTGKRRLLVDAGGIYVSLIIATGASVTYGLSHLDIAAAMTALCDLTIVVNLNPFLRMDGYWILSDVLDLPHLMDLNRVATLAYIRRYLLRRSNTVLPIIPEAFPGAAMLYRCYYAVFSIVMLLGCFLLLYRGVPFVVLQYPGVVGHAFHSLVTAPQPWVAIKTLMVAALSTVTAFSITVIIVRLSAFLYGQLALLKTSLGQLKGTDSDRGETCNSKGFAATHAAISRNVEGGPDPSGEMTSAQTEELGKINHSEHKEARKQEDEPYERTVTR